MKSVRETANGVATGVPVGIFLELCCVPFGPVLLGWLVALVGAVIITAGLCVLAKDHETIVGVGYAAGFARIAVITRIVTSGIGNDWQGLPAQFAAIFMIVASASLLGSSPCTLLKWEDKKARDNAQAE